MIQQPENNKTTSRTHEWTVDPTAAANQEQSHEQLKAGFEKFNIKWIEKYKDKFQLSRSSLIATLTQLTSISVSDAINSNDLDSDKIFFAGGGSKNPLIKREILKRTGLSEIENLPWGLDFKNIESSAFAWLAMTRVKGKLISRGYLTGAKTSRLLGIIYR